MARNNKNLKSMLRRHLGAVAVAVVGACLTGLSYLYIVNTQTDRQQAELASEAKTYRDQISYVFQQHLNRLNALEAYFTTRRDVSRDQFSTFAAKLLQGLKGIQAIEWVPRVPAARRETLEQTARFHGFSGFEFKQRDGDGNLVRAGDRAEYFPIYFVEPYADNQKALGFDLASSKIRKATLDDSRDTGKAVLSRRIMLIQETEKQFGILAFHPIYRRDIRADTIERRRQGLLGFVLGVFRVSDLVQSALSRLAVNPHLVIDIADMNAQPSQQTLYSSVPENSDRRSTAAVTLPIALANIDGAWSITVTPLPGHPIFASSSLALFELITGLLITVMMSAITVSQTNREQVTRQIVADKTRELRASEERFRDFAVVSADWFWETDASLRFCFLSDQFEQVTGVKPATLIGKTSMEIDPPDVDAKVWQTYIDTLIAHKPVKGFIYPRPLGEDQVVYLSISGQPMFDDTGDFKGYRGIGRDVTERERLERVKDELISSISHELRTPLTSIKAALGMLKSGVLGELPEKAREMINLADNNGERLNTLVNNILDIESLTKNPIELRLARLDLSSFVSAQVIANRNIADDNNVSFAFIEPDAEYFVEADATKLAQVIGNLLSNAAKFSPDGDIVDISVAGNGGVVRVAVTDHGPGVPEGFRDQIFGRFAQADSSDTRRPGGAGLGLHISRSIIEKHHGELNYVSEVGNGSTFFFELREVTVGAENIGTTDTKARS